MPLRCALPAKRSRARRRKPSLALPLQGRRFALIDSGNPAPDPLQHSDDRRRLRQQLRQRRRALNPCAQHQASLALMRRLIRLPVLRRARHVALYLPENGEIDPTPLIRELKARGVRIYLPVLRPLVENRLWFVRLQDDTQLVLNRFRITEPAMRQSAARTRRLPPWALDVVLMPLVGFDAYGHRLGMGGGFYDRTFAFASHRHGPRPALIGVAHTCQQVSALPHQPWDVNLDMIVSDRQVWHPA